MEGQENYRSNQDTKKKCVTKSVQTCVNYETQMLFNVLKYYYYHHHYYYSMRPKLSNWITLDSNEGQGKGHSNS